MMRSALTWIAFSSIAITAFSGCNVPGFSAKQDFSQTIPVNSKVEVDATTFNGNITVSPNESSEIELVAHMKAYGASQAEADKMVEELKPTIDTSTSVVTIKCNKRSNSLMTMDSVQLELKVPATWPLRLTTSNGTIKTKDSLAAIVAKTSNGQIEVLNSTGSLELATSNGRITVDGMTGPIDAHTSNGAVKILNCSLEGKCHVHTSNGTIEVGLNDNQSIKVDASTSNGTIRCDDDRMSFSKQKKTHIAGTWESRSESKKATSSSLELETSNGSITIKAAEPRSNTSDTPTIDEASQPKEAA